MIGALTFVGAVVAGGLSGALVHEFAHYAVWLASGRRPRVSIRGLFVEPTAGGSEVEPSDRLAALAPVLLGVSLLPAVIQEGALPLWVGWVTLTLTGAREDWQLAAGRMEEIVISNE